MESILQSTQIYSRVACKSYALFKEVETHPSLKFKKVNDNPAVYSVRISLRYRALGVKEGSFIIWFCIGNHEAYDKQIDSL